MIVQITQGPSSTNSSNASINRTKGKNKHSKHYKKFIIIGYFNMVKSLQHGKITSTW